ncbi:LamG-like jellyroll fold domain-containing protein [Nonomuraea sp. NPDC004354]
MAVRFTADGQQYTRTISLGTVSAWTVAFWFKISVDLNAISCLWQLTDAEGATFSRLRLSTDGLSLLFQQQGGSSASVTGRTLTAGTWYFVAVSVNGTTGQLISRAPNDASFTVEALTGLNSGGTDHATLVIGNDLFGGEPVNGAMASFKHWSGVALSQAEVEAEYASNLPRRTANLRRWHPFTREAIDYSGNAQTLSGGTGATFEDGPPLAWRQHRRSPLIPGEIPVEVLADTITATSSIPTPGISLGTNVQTDLITATSSIPTPDIFTGGAVTPVQPTVIQGSASVPTPSVSTVKNVSATPPVIAAIASVPMPDVFVPINPGDDLNGKGQISYNGFKMGGGTVYSLQRLIGTPWDMPALDNGDVPHPSAHGSLPGQKHSQARIFTVETLIKTPREQVEDAANAFLAGLPVPDADEQLPIALQVLDTIYIGFGACTKRDAPVEKRTPLGLVPASAQFTMADPRFYSRELLSATIPDGGNVDVLNAGNTTTYPILRCPGPAQRPLLEIARMLPDGSEDIRVIEYDLEVPAGQALIIDTKLGTVSIGGVSQAQARTNASVSIPDMVFGKGISTIAYETLSGTAPPAVALWKHAYL